MFKLLLGITFILATLGHPMQKEGNYGPYVVDFPQEDFEESARSLNQPDDEQMRDAIGTLIEELSQPQIGRSNDALGSPDNYRKAYYEAVAQQFIRQPPVIASYPTYRQPYYSGPFRSALYHPYDPVYQQKHNSAPSFRSGATDSQSDDDVSDEEALTLLRELKGQQPKQTELESSVRFVPIGSLPVATIEFIPLSVKVARKLLKVSKAINNLLSIANAAGSVANGVANPPPAGGNPVTTFQVVTVTSVVTVPATNTGTTVTIING